MEDGEELYDLMIAQKSDFYDFVKQLSVDQQAALLQHREYLQVCR